MIKSICMKKNLRKLQNIIKDNILLKHILAIDNLNYMLLINITIFFIPKIHKKKPSIHYMLVQIQFHIIYIISVK